jgi:hypothetical protein
MRCGHFAPASIVPTACAVVFACLFLVAPVLGADKTLAQIDFSVQWKFDSPSDAGRVFLDVVLHNISDSTIFFAEQSPDWDYQIDAVGPDGISPVERTNFGKCVFPRPIDIFRNISRSLEPGAKDHVESVELNRLFKLNRAGLYRIVLRREIWVKASDMKMVSSEPAYFSISSPQVDSSPPFPEHCR